MKCGQHHEEVYTTHIPRIVTTNKTFCNEICYKLVINNSNTCVDEETAIKLELLCQQYYVYMCKLKVY